MQSSDIIEYRGEIFCITNIYPFYTYLKEKKIELQSSSSPSDLDRGYQGCWKFINNKLYLIKLNYCDLQIKNIFETDLPILANWYSGELEIGFGNYHDDNWNVYYDDYLWLLIKKGIVIERRIIKHIYEDIVIETGKYKGRNFEEILFGKIHKRINSTINNYLEKLLEFICNIDVNYSVAIPPYTNTSQSEIDLIEEIRENGIHYFLTQNYLAISDKSIWTNSHNEVSASSLSSMLEKVLTGNFSELIMVVQENVKESTPTESSILINSDFEYIISAIQHLKDFAIPPSLLNKTFKIKTLKTFKINRLNSSIFEYNPIIEEKEYIFNDKIRELNQKKFEELNNLEFNAKYGFYTLNYDDNEMFNCYGFYLDETYTAEKVYKSSYNNKHRLNIKVKVIAIKPNQYKDNSFVALLQQGYTAPDGCGTTRSVYMDIPSDLSIEEVQKRIPEHAVIYEIISNAPILSENHKHIIRKVI